MSTLKTEITRLENAIKERKKVAEIAVPSFETAICRLIETCGSEERGAVKRYTLPEFRVMFEEADRSLEGSAKRYATYLIWIRHPSDSSAQDQLVFDFCHDVRAYIPGDWEKKFFDSVKKSIDAKLREIHEAEEPRDKERLATLQKEARENWGIE